MINGLSEKLGELIKLVQTERQNAEERLKQIQQYSFDEKEEFQEEGQPINAEKYSEKQQDKEKSFIQDHTEEPNKMFIQKQTYNLNEPNHQKKTFVKQKMEGPNNVQKILINFQQKQEEDLQERKVDRQKMQKSRNTQNSHTNQQNKQQFNPKQHQNVIQFKQNKRWEVIAQIINQIRSFNSEEKKKFLKKKCEQFRFSSSQLKRLINSYKIIFSIEKQITQLQNPLIQVCTVQVNNFRPDVREDKLMTQNISAQERVDFIKPQYPKMQHFTQEYVQSRIVRTIHKCSTRATRIPSANEEDNFKTLKRTCRKKYQPESEYMNTLHKYRKSN